ncbi:MAG: tail fiber domain-containing protein, partial [Tannerella sp.]|nr:tail fiber domain-containing protein [Tannerella sp.]
MAKIRQLKGKSYEKLVVSGKGNAAEVEQMVAEGKIPKEKAQEALSELNARKKDTYKSEYGFIAQDVKALFP